MVERARLDVIETEWTFARGGLADTATALRELRPLGASLLLICRPEPGDLSKPAASCEVIDAITAEPLAAARAELSDRPFARWYRNPPPEDVQAIAAASRDALAQALAVRAAQAGQRLLTPLFFVGAGQSSDKLESALSTALSTELARAPGWRLRRPLRLDGPRAEALLAATGFSPEGTTRRSDTDAYLWGRFEPLDANDTSRALRYWIWNGVAAPEEHLARGGPAELAADIVRSLKNSSRPEATGGLASDSGAEETRLRLAHEMIEEARALARSTGLDQRSFFSRLPQHMRHEPLRVEIMRLLASAAFLAPTDPEAQELWLRTALDRDYSLRAVWDEKSPAAPRPPTGETRRLEYEMIAFGEAFWRRADGSLDLRLLQLVYDRDPTRLASPRFMSALREQAALIGRPPREQLIRHESLIYDWLHALEQNCPYFKWWRAQSGTAWPGRPPPFESPSAETLETFEALWPLLNILRSDKTKQPGYLDFFFERRSARKAALLATGADQSAGAGQTRLFASTTPSLFPQTALSAPVPEKTALAANPDLAPPMARLRQACSRPGQLEAIRALLRENADPLGSENRQTPPLLVAIEARQETYVLALLDAKPDLQRPWFEDNSPGPSGVYLLHAAIANNLSIVASRLLEAVSAQVGGVQRRKEDSLLGIAIKHGDIGLVRRLSSLGARLGEDSDNAVVDIVRRCTPHDSSQNSESVSLDYVRDVLRLLRASDPDAVNRLQDKFGTPESPLLVAVQARHHELVESLIAAGATPQNERDPIGRSVADLAAADVVMQRLLQGQTLALARSGRSSADGPDGAELVAQIQRRGTAALAEIKLTPALLSYQDAKKWTLLHHVIDRSDDAQALRLISAGAPLEAASIAGQTPLKFAVSNNRPRVVDALLAKGANPDGRGSRTAIPPLAAAVLAEQPEMIRRLLKAGADVDITLYEEEQPLLAVVISNNKKLDVLHLLVDAGARLDATDDEGYGALEYAIAKDRVDALEYLRAKGARWARPPGVQDYSPIRHAVRWKAKNALLFLLRQGERDPGAIGSTRDPELKALLGDAMHQDAGGKAFADEELWPAICKDTLRWRERMEAHIAAGGDVNHGSLEWTPLVLAASVCNPDMVRHLLAKGADPKIHPQQYRNKPSWDLSDYGTLRFAWSRARIVDRSEFFDEPKFAEIVRLLVPLEPCEDNQWLFFMMVESKCWTAAEAFLQTGIRPTAYMRAKLISKGHFKGADLDRALSLLGDPAPPATR
jgi:ankyrin repeat protein